MAAEREMMVTQNVQWEDALPGSTETDYWQLQHSHQGGFLGKEKNLPDSKACHFAGKASGQLQLLFSVPLLDILLQLEQILTFESCTMQIHLPHRVQKGSRRWPKTGKHFSPLEKCHKIGASRFTHTHTHTRIYTPKTHLSLTGKKQSSIFVCEP